MSRTAEIRKTLTETKPLMAYVGTVDLAVEQARKARVEADARRARFQARVAELPTTTVKVVTDLAGQAPEVPALALNRALEVQAQTQARYDALATRGQKLVTRIRNQKATKDLVAQAETAVAQAKGALTTVQTGAAEVERSTKALVTTGRREAARAAEAIAASVTDEVETATAEVKTSAARTRTAAKRTSTTTRKAAAKSTSAAMGARTSARKTAAGATKAAEKAAEKVGK